MALIGVCEVWMGAVALMLFPLLLGAVLLLLLLLLLKRGPCALGLVEGRCSRLAAAFLRAEEAATERRPWLLLSRRTPVQASLGQMSYTIVRPSFLGTVAHPTADALCLFRARA